MRQAAEKVMVRLPSGMRDMLRQRALASRRSMNAEIVHYLDRALAAGDEKGPAEAATSPDLEPTNPS